MQVRRVLFFPTKNVVFIYLSLIFTLSLSLIPSKVLFWHCSMLPVPHRSSNRSKNVKKVLHFSELNLNEKRFHIVFALHTICSYIKVNIINKFSLNVYDCSYVKIETFSYTKLKKVFSPIVENLHYQNNVIKFYSYGLRMIQKFVKQIRPFRLLDLV